MPEDLVIIGGGPAGCTAAIYAARAELKTVVVDRGVTAGALGMAERVDNFPGLPQVGGAELVEIMRQQAASFGVRFTQDRVTGVELQGELKQIYTNNNVFETRAVIIATGSMGRVFTVPGEQQLLGKGVSYCATCDGAFFRNKAVAVVGDTDEALEEARFLTRFAQPIYFITRKAEPPGNPPEQAVTITGAVLKRITGEKAVTGIVIKREREEETIEVKGVFIYLHGNRPVTDFLGGVLPTDSFGCLEVDEEMQTTISGVFAAGDILCPEVKQAVVATAEGCRAAMHAIRYLNQKVSLLPDWKK